jgi:hypothetical protein
MAITETNLPGNGTAGPFTYTFPALEAGDIYVSVDGVVKTVTTDYSLNFVGKQITFLTTPYPTVSNVIRIYRVTDDADLAATFYSGAAIRATDLNTNFTQGLYVTQESNREAATAISTAGSAVTTANAATATANSAVSTANAATATANTALSNSSAAVSTANTASSNASAAVSTANTASSNASAAVSTANTASSNATNAVNTANAATATANSAASDAATAISTANGAVTTANNAAADAATAISTANTASSNASAAVSTANTASSNATSAVNTANSALSTANAAASAVANAILYDIVANVAAIPASPANNDAVEVTDSTGIESFTPLTSIPGGFAGNSGLSVRIVYTTTGNTWTWIQYFPNDPETRYLKEAVTTSDTAPVSPSDGDLWYDSVGGRTYVYYADGDSSQWVDTSPQGSGVSDAISEGNTSAEVIDTGSDGRFVVTTEGTERLRVDASGRLGIGTTNPAYKCDIDVTGSALRLNSTTSQALLVISSDDAANAKIEFGDESDNDRGAITYDNPNNALIFQANAAERLRITSAGLVGIGTSQPVGQTYIAGPNTSNFGVAADAALNIAAASGALANRIINLNFAVVPSATNAVAAIGMAYGSQSGFGNGHLIFGTRSVTTDTAPTERMRIDSSGRVGIGTTSPSSYSAAGDNLVIADAGNCGITLAAGTSSTGQILFADGTTGADTIRGIIGYTHASNDLFFGTNAVERLRIDSSGRVGIGTSSPDLKLEVSGGQNQTANQFTDLFRVAANANNDSAAAEVQLNFGISPSDTDAANRKARIQAQTSDGTGRDLLINPAGGNVGIGTTSPVRKLNLVSTGEVYQKFSNNSTGSSTTNGFDIGIGSGKTAYIWNYEADSTVFGTNGSERMRITQGGHVLIGCTSLPNSSIKGAGFYITNTDTEYLSSINTTASKTHVIFYNPNGTVGTIATSGSATAYNTSSDYRLKENVTPVSDGITRLQQLKPSRFNFIADPDKTVDGFLAHEVQTIIPEAITGEKDAVDDEGNPEYQGIDQSKLVPLLTAALQEAIARIEAQDTTIASLEARLTALEGGTN